MISSNKVSYFKPHSIGVTSMGNNGAPKGHGVSFAFDTGYFPKDTDNFGVIIYHKDNSIDKLPFSSEYHTGTVYGLSIEGLSIGTFSYNFYINDEIYTDTKAYSYIGLEKFGSHSENKIISAGFEKHDFDWEDDKSPMYAYEDSILYGLNVRAFTKNRYSKVAHKGTYEGIVEKIPYLKELGITAIVLMPTYEYDECLALNEPAGKISSNPQINCWGFQKAYYYAPKASYSYGKNPIISFKNMVKALHKENIEVIMQFYFSPDISSLFVVEAMKYWIYEYHVDGFRIEGFHIPYRILLKDPILRGTKIWFSYIPEEENDSLKASDYRNIAISDGPYRYELRKLLKGDEGMIGSYISLHKFNPEKTGAINMIADYDGFSLYDIYSYERKHNEANGEDNTDGSDFNLSWNCGIEGDTKKRNILDLRKKQIKNALTLLFTSQGTPYIFSGDEFGNTRYGNNNAYCQDNDTGYVKWKLNSFNSDILEYTKKLIALRKSLSFLHQKESFRNLDINKSGYPDLSYHGLEAYIPDTNYSSRYLGLFLYKLLSDSTNENLYIGINMHWEDKTLAIPLFKEKVKVGYFLSTENKIKSEDIVITENSICIPPRSIIMISFVPDDTPVINKTRKGKTNEKTI